MSGRRLASGGLIDRDRPLGFRFDGTDYRGYAGDTLASALLAAGVTVAGRSFKYHRPRGLFAAGAEESNILVQLGQGATTEPNLKATQVELHDGLVARSVNCWPSARFDIGAALGVFKPFLPAGFYYKTFMWPHWKLFEPFIRRAAGLGVAPTAADPDRYAVHHAHCDVLVVGAGPAGLEAARHASAAGLRVILADEQPQPGGSLLWNGAICDALDGLDWAGGAAAEIMASGRSRLLVRTTVVGYYDHNLLVAVQQLPDSGGDVPRQRLWKIRARRVVLATGACERPIAYAGNDLPGTMLASAITQYVNRYAVLPGTDAVLFTSNDSGYETARCLVGAGARVRAIVDTRAADSDSPLQQWALERGLRVLHRAVVVAAHGRTRVRSVEIKSQDGAPQVRLDCDLVGVAGGWNPVVHLFSQSGGKLRFDTALAAFVPDAGAQAQQSAGSANGCFDTAACREQGAAAGIAAALACGACAPQREPPLLEPARTPVQDTIWLVPGTQLSTAFVDLQNDVTAADLGLAVREGYRSVELLKRYTTLGMGVDQGKTSNVTGLGILGELTAREPAAVGTTRFRPPYAPVTLGAVAANWPGGELLRPRRYMPGHAWHAAAGAAFFDYGWERPSHYPLPGEGMEQSAQREARAVRTRAGMLEGSPLGKFEVLGRDAGAFLDRLYVGTMSTLRPGQIRYGLMLNEHGTVIDDGVVACLAEGHFLLNTSSGHAERIGIWLEEWRQCEWPDLEVLIQDLTHCRGVVTLAGPHARAVLQAAGSAIDLDPTRFPHMHWREGEVAGIAARVLRVSYSGEASYEINVPARCTAELLARLHAAGAPLGLVSYGIEALDLLRIEKGYLHVGTDTDSATLPGDIGFGGAIARKATDFIGRRSLAREDALRVDRQQLVGIASAQRIQTGTHILDAHGRSAGFVTSSCHGPGLGRPVALALLRGGRARIGEEVTLYAQGGQRQATVCSPVQYDPEGGRLHD